MDHSPLCSSVHEILQARILEWLAIPFSRGPSWPRDRARVSCIAGSSLPSEPQESLKVSGQSPRCEHGPCIFLHKLGDSCGISQSCLRLPSPTKAEPLPSTLPCIRTMTETLKRIRRELTQRDYFGGRKTDQLNASSSTWLTWEGKSKVRYGHRRPTKPWSVHSEGLRAAPGYPPHSLSLPSITCAVEGKPVFGVWIIKLLTSPSLIQSLNTWT